MATDKLIEALQRVVEAARELSDNAEPRADECYGWMVETSDMIAIREALAECSEVGDVMLAEWAAAGEDGETAHAAAWLGAVQADVAAAKQGAK